MNTIRITKEFKFEMAHALYGYDGPCRNIHGHSYNLFVTIKGKPVCNSNSPKDGMLMDFGDLKNSIKNLIIDKFDHSLVLNNKVDAANLKKTDGMFGNIVLVNYQPTSENMLIDFAKQIKKSLPKNVLLHSLKLCETATSYAEWFADDNE